MSRRVAGLAITIASLACSTPRAATRTEAGPELRPLEGTVAVLTTVDAKGCKESRDCAQSDAVRALLFVGVPGSRVSKAMVPNERDAVRSHQAFFSDLFEKKGYGRFVVRVDDRSTSTTPAADKPWNVVINTDALRRALEEAGVVRRFGY